MNILFIEDEKELLEMAMSQLEHRGHTVYPAADIAHARSILSDESKNVQIVITDHRLPDGLGIKFAIEIKSTHPNAKSAIISGCLTDENIAEIESHGLLYFHKPLLYGKVVENIRRHYSFRANVVKVPEVKVEAEPEPEVQPQAKAKKKKLWGLFDKTSSTSVSKTSK